MEDNSVNLLITELRHGFGELSDGLKQLSNRVDQTNLRLDQTNYRLDESIIRQDKALIGIELLRAETNFKLDGIGKYLQSINGSVARHDQSLHDLSKRVYDLENDAE